MCVRVHALPSHLPRTVTKEDHGSFFCASSDGAERMSGRGYRCTTRGGWAGESDAMNKVWFEDYSCVFAVADVGSVDCWDVDRGRGWGMGRTVDAAAIGVRVKVRQVESFGG